MHSPKWHRVATHFSLQQRVCSDYHPNRPPFHQDAKEQNKRNSHTGNRTRIGRVRACYPNQLDYMGPVLCFQNIYINSHIQAIPIHNTTTHPRYDYANKHITQTLLLRLLLLLLLRHLPFTTNTSTHLGLQKGETSVHVQRENRRLIAVVVVLFMERLLQSQNAMVHYLALHQSLVLVLRELKSLLERHFHNDRALGSHTRSQQLR